MYNFFTEAHNCNSFIWQFLSYLLIIKANAALHKVERTSEALAKAASIAIKLKEKDINHFVNACISCKGRIFILPALTVNVIESTKLLFGFNVKPPLKKYLT